MARNTSKRKAESEEGRKQPSLTQRGSNEKTP